MTTQEWLLTKLIEECAEVIQECTKSQTFGLDNISPYNNKKNIENLITELNDVLCVLCTMTNKNIIPAWAWWVDGEYIEQKHLKLLNSLAYAKTLGIVQ
jgi:NTP pyrophosphatase (non-canonical NTP hydrolase)